MFIDGIEVPENPITNDPAINIIFQNGQWILADAIGKDLSRQYRAVPRNLINKAALFQDTNGKKVGYIPNELLMNYIQSVKPPKGPDSDLLQQELNRTAKSIQDTMRNLREPDPEVAKLSEKFRRQYLAPGQAAPTPSAFVPLNQDGSVKRTAIKPGVSAGTAGADLAQTPITEQVSPATRTVDAKDAISSRWSAISNLDYDPNNDTVTGADGLPAYVLVQKTKVGPKVIAFSDTQLNSALSSLSVNEIREYQRALSNAGAWSGNVDGELNYLTRQAFNNAIKTAAAAATQENLQAYKTNGAPKSILDIINEAAKAAGGSQTQTTVTIINRESAQQYLDNTYLNSIGRKATKKEVDEFYRKVQKEAKARPDVSTTTGTQTTRRQGFDESTLVDMASAQAEARPEFLAYQLSTNFYDALRGAAQLPIEFGEAPTTGPLGG